MADRGGLTDSERVELARSDWADREAVALRIGARFYEKGRADLAAKVEALAAEYECKPYVVSDCGRGECPGCSQADRLRAVLASRQDGMSCHDDGEGMCHHGTCDECKAADSTPTEIHGYNLPDLCGVDDCQERHKTEDDMESARVRGDGGDHG